MNEGETYRPLPESVRLSEGIEGFGIFARQYIPAARAIGLGHVRFHGQPDGWLRTPLGGFVNHSLSPNCQAQLRGAEIWIVALRDIEPEEELTVFYWLPSYEEPIKTGEWD